MIHRALGRSGLNIVPLVVGGNVFGWTIDEKKSFEILDGAVESGLNAIDTADSYSTWVEGHKGGESESIIGNWLKRNPGNRRKMLLFTKVGSDLGGDRKGLSARWIVRAAEESLRRLQTDVIDLYQSHWPDESTPIEETLSAYDSLLKAGKVRAIGASNLSKTQLEESLRVSKERGLPPYTVLQPHYNLYDRQDFEDGLQEACVREGLGVITYFSLASGFLSGKYRSKDDTSKSQRGAGISKYLTPRGMRILKALDETASKHAAKPAEVALAWLMGRPGVTAPIASATSLEQLASLVKAVTLTLSADDRTTLDAASV